MLVGLYVADDKSTYFSQVFSPVVPVGIEISKYLSIACGTELPEIPEHEASLTSLQWDVFALNNHHFDPACSIVLFSSR